MKQIITIIFNHRCYPTLSRIPALVPNFTVHDVPAVGLFFVAFGTLGARAAVVVGTNSIAMGPTVAILDPIGSVIAAISATSFDLEREDLLVEGPYLAGEAFVGH